MRESPSPDCKGFVPVCISGYADHLPSLMEKSIVERRKRSARGR